MDNANNSSDGKSRVALLWRGDRAMRTTATAKESRLKHIFAALAARGIDAEPAIFSEDCLEGVRTQLLACDGVLVWVDPLSDGRTRAALDPLLRDIAAHGIWVSAHPDTILKMGTKEVLYRTRHLGWGVDTRIYRTVASFRAEFPVCLMDGAPRVLKQKRGNGGQGVWKVERVAQDRVRVLEGKRGSMPEETSLDVFMERCENYFEDDGLIVDQPFQPRPPDGMIRCYLGKDKVVGFGHQLIKALIPPPPEGPDAPQAQPGPRIMQANTAAQFQKLRVLMETDWVPGLMRTLMLSRDDLPIIWDADFLYGPKDANGDDTYVLCEINVSSVFPIPDEAPEEIARLVLKQLAPA